jgi:hypothetical protein
MALKAPMKSRKLCKVTFSYAPPYGLLTLKADFQNALDRVSSRPRGKDISTRLSL